jgi:glutaredoxin/glutathione-dependent peroxiredoxin
MPIKVGDKMPSGTLTLATADGPQKVSADDYFKGKKVVLFSVPGAFTPTCDAKHLPGFVEKAADIKKKGVATIACLSVNDAFGNGEYTKALGLELDATGFGMGMRGQRFSLVIDNGVVKQVNVEQKGEFKVSSAEHALTQL